MLLMSGQAQPDLHDLAYRCWVSRNALASGFLADGRTRGWRLAAQQPFSARSFSMAARTSASQGNGSSLAGS